MDVFNQLAYLIGSPGWGLGLLLLLNIISVICLFVISRVYGWKNKVPAFGILIVQAYWFWSFVTVLRGISDENDYWDWKFLIVGYLPSVLISLTLFVGVNIDKCHNLFHFILRRIFLFSILVVPIAMNYSEELYARFVMPICLFVLLIPYLPLRWRYLVGGVALISMFMDVTYRANVIRLLIPMALVVTYFFKFIVNKILLNVTLATLFGTPLLLLALGLSGGFNVFSDNMIDYQKETVSAGQVGESNIGDDTRTFLYREIIYSMMKKNSSFIVGEGASAGYETDFFADAILNDKGRTRSEVGFLNTLLYSGGVGVIAYALILFIPAYYGINKSKNYLAKMMGIFLAWRWIVFYLEDIAQFDMNFFVLWLMIGMCLSNKFREMTDSDLKVYFSKPIPKYFRGGLNGS